MSTAPEHAAPASEVIARVREIKQAAEQWNYARDTAHPDTVRWLCAQVERDQARVEGLIRTASRIAAQRDRVIEKAQEAHERDQAELARLRAGQVPQAEVWRHKQRGTRYEIVGTVRIQCPADMPMQDDEQPLLYRDIDSGHYGARRPGEFYDGRFERVSFSESATPAPQQAPSPGAMARAKKALGPYFNEIMGRTRSLGESVAAALEAAKLEGRRDCAAAVIEYATLKIGSKVSDYFVDGLRICALTPPSQSNPQPDRPGLSRWRGAFAPAAPEDDHNWDEQTNTEDKQ